MAQPVRTESVDTNVWTIDPSHTVVEFSVRHMMFATVRGRFGSVEGTVKGDPGHLETASIQVRIDAASVDTREAQRDQHLRSADFFDVEHHPQITFTSRRITQKEGSGAPAYEVIGDLTIRGVTREVILSTRYNGRGRDPWGFERVGFSAEGAVNRKDFGLVWNAPLEAGGFLVGDEIRITLEVQAVKQG